MTPAEINQLVATEIASISCPTRRAALQHALVRPTSHERTSQYVDGRFVCWVVASDSGRRRVLVYCRGHFADPWGCLDPDDTDLGVDAQWFGRLDDSFLFGMWDGPLPPGYEVE